MDCVSSLVTMIWLGGFLVVGLALDLVLGQANWHSQQTGSRRKDSLQSGWGSARGSPRQLLVPSRGVVSIMCLEDMMVVTIQKNLYGNGKLIKASDLTLGSELCEPSSEDQDTVTFQISLQDCGNRVQTTTDFLLYATNIAYKPSSSRNVPITRTNSANIGVQCYYPRHGNVSSNAIRPTWIPFSSTISMEERLSFALNLMKDDWSGLRDSNVVSLGNSLHIEAFVTVDNHVPMRIVVDSCVALLALDPDSTPRYELINNYGCLVDGQQEDSSSTFISQRPEPNILRFEVDAFRFTGRNQPTIYIYCVLKAVPLNQEPNPTNKACSFSKTSNSWSPVEGAANICSCCESGNCDASQPRRLRPGSRRPWKRHLAERSDEVIHTQLLGPIWIIDPEADLQPESGQALAVRADPEQEVKPWMVMAVGGLWVTVLVGAVLAWKIGSRKRNVANVQQ
ncbi:zona pellucida sperm-binding protein 3-like isoform X2 [Rana temporaria]|uniref:zona pellucida sperm-binding protein 3-like isoform X2 n=1 Tax=Rana temporaria TaxID=8407 RepID=UPI001AAD0107|nr:zona pellucida sperm-binding protein 3-like isoform X2 [Rana temporaria]